jgi:hypothetical protein
MASEIHKRRTGKAFKISEEIVMKEEMYEEEDEDLPRAYQLLASHLQTQSPDMDYRLNAFLANKVAMASMVAGLSDAQWRDSGINRLFRESFPGLLPQRDAPKPTPDQQQQQQQQLLANSRYYAGIQPTFSEMPRSGGNGSTSTNLSTMSYQFPDHESRSGSLSGSSSTEISTPNTGEGSVSPLVNSAFTSPIVNTSMPYTSSEISGSVFTTELSAEAKMLANIDMTDPLAPGFYNGFDPNQPNLALDVPAFSTNQDINISGDLDIRVETMNSGITPPIPPQAQDYFSAGHNKLEMSGQKSTISTPGGGLGDAWDTFVDYNAYNPNDYHLPG